MMMKNKNAVILLFLAALTLLVLGLSLLVPKTAPVIDRDVQELELEFTPSSALPAHRHERSGALCALFGAAHAHAEEPSSPASPAPTATPLPPDQVRAYLMITVGQVTYSPIPLTQEGDYTIRQKELGRVNVIHVTPDSVTMASSTCDNQLCVGEGTVTLDNKETRILGGYIICLPNEVTLELYAAEELRALQSGASSR